MSDLIAAGQLERMPLRRAVVNSIVRSKLRSGVLHSDHEAQIEALRLFRIIDSSQESITSPLIIDELTKLDSQEWNRFLDSIAIDLRSTYQAISQVEATEQKMGAIGESDLRVARLGVLTARAKLEAFQFLREYPEYQDVKIIDFCRPVNVAKRSPRAVIDNRIRMLKLPATGVEAPSISGPGRRVVARASNLGGGIAFSPEGLGPENAVDKTPSTYWVQFVSHSGPVFSRVDTSWGSYEAHGAVSELVVEFDHGAQANAIRLLPFCERPVNIVDVAYSDIQTGESWMPIPDFQIVESASDWVELSFPPMAVSKIRILLEQPSYVRQTYHIPRRLAGQEGIWQQIYAGAYEYSRVGDISDSEIVRSAVDPSRLPLLMSNEIGDRTRTPPVAGGYETPASDFSVIAQRDVARVSGIEPSAAEPLRELGVPTPPEKDDLVDVVRYEYVAGLRHVEVVWETYAATAHYESPALGVRGNPITVELESSEIHLEMDHGLGLHRQTSVEYALETSPGVRFPIHPITDSDAAGYLVRDELLILVNGVGYLRFLPVAASVTARKNGVRVLSSEVTISGRQITISGADPSAIYTVSYRVGDASTIVNIDGELNSTSPTSPEVFFDTDGDNALTLAYYPYTVYEIVRDGRLWEKEASSRWRWDPDFVPITRGTITLTNGDATVLLTKESGDDLDFSDMLVTSGMNLSVYVPELGVTLSIATVTDATHVELSAPYDGDTRAGLAFEAGRSSEADGRTWGLQQKVYEPVRVLVDGVPASNVTDYVDMQHPAFSATTRSDTVEFIQVGRKLYFNQPVHGRKIEVWYSWLCQYLKVIAILRCNSSAAKVTPKVDWIRLRVRSTEI